MLRKNRKAGDWRLGLSGRVYIGRGFNPEDAIPDSIAEEARRLFYENSQKDRADRYRIVFKAGWVKVGKPFMVRSQESEFVVWVEGGGVEDFRIEQVESFELLPPTG
jgi:hypothetical protein